MSAIAVSREELWVAIGLSRGAQPSADHAVEQAYLRYEEIDWLRVIKSPHGRPWNTSFHASAFPGGEQEKYCGREAMYKLLNIPGQPFQPRSRAIMEQGRAAERQIVYRMGHAGMTLSGSVSLDPDVDGKQLNLMDPTYWLTGSLDAALDGRLLRPRSDRVVPLDVKSKDDKGLLKLRLGEAQPPRNYVAQVMTYCYLARIYHAEMGWEDIGLREAEGGIIYFVSRNNPRDTHEHWVKYDQGYVDAGLERLERWIQHFHDGELPERDRSWRWTEDPCKWCDYKKACKQDIKDGVVHFVESSAVALARTRNADYDPRRVVRQVKEAWE